MSPLTAVTACRCLAQPPCTFRGMSKPDSGPAVSASSTLTGTRTTTVHVSSADEVWPTSRAAALSRLACRAGRASTGTMTLVSAPPRTTS